MEYHCPHCEATVPEDLRWKTFANGTRHIESRCLYCRAFLRWAMQTPEAVAAAKPELRPATGDLFDMLPG